MHRNLNILASGVLEQTKVRNGERLMEKIASLERTEDKSTPTIHLTHLGSQFMPKDILEKVKKVFVTFEVKTRLFYDYTLLQI